MTPDQIRTALERALTGIAPEADPRTLPEDADLREELDLDSMDFLNLVMALNKQLHVEIPEADYQRISTLRGALSYLAAKLPA